MSEAEIEGGRPLDIVEVDIRAWVEAARANPVLYRNRRVIEVVLASIGLAPGLATALTLKGGTLMSLAFGSRRATGDVDFSAEADPVGFDMLLKEALDAQFPKTAVALGYLDLICRVQSVRKMPKPLNFAEHRFPALLVRIGSARRGTAEARRLEAGAAPQVVEVEISFRDRVYRAQELMLVGAGVTVRAFSIHELIAEKLRALLQQSARNRYRRQDVYDIAHLLDGHAMTTEDRAVIYRTFLDKCRTRRIVPTAASIEDPDLVRRARVDWETIALEVENLPDFAERYAIVAAFYRSLPWPEDL
jgi:predicted nucleotidyltransferase component of viral defense system